VLISAHEMEAKNIYVLKWFEIYTRVLASSTIVVDMPCDKREQTVVSVSHMYRHICAIDHLVGRVYRHMSAYVNLAGHVVSSTKMAIHTAGCVYSIVLNIIFGSHFRLYGASSWFTIRLLRGLCSRCS